MLSGVRFAVSERSASWSTSTTSRAATPTWNPPLPALGAGAGLPTMSWSRNNKTVVVNTVSGGATGGPALQPDRGMHRISAPLCTRSHGRYAPVPTYGPGAFIHPPSGKGKSPKSVCRMVHSPARWHPMVGLRLLDSSRSITIHVARTRKDALGRMRGFLSEHRHL